MSLSKDDENFLKDFLKDFYHQVINIKDYAKFETILMEWIQDFFKYNKKNSKIILELMRNHEENENWFSSLIGFFYEHGIGGIIDKNKSLELYSSINNERNKKLVSVYQIINIIIVKYLLSFYYYKDIILNMIANKQNGMSISQNQFENFNELKVNICEDEINTIEKHFELLNNNLIDSDEQMKNQDYAKKDELVEQNYLGYCYQWDRKREK